MYVRRAGTSARCSAPSPISAAQRPCPPRHRCRCVCGGGSKQRPAPAPPAGARLRSYRRTSAGVARALRRILRRLSSPYPRHKLRPSPFPPRAVCLSRAACALPLVRLTPLPPASAAAVRCAGNGVLRRQWLPTPAHPCHFVIPPVCLVCEPLSNCLLSAQAGGCRCSMRSRNPEVRWRNGGATWLRRMLASYIGDAASCGTSARTTALRYGHRRCELRAPSSTTSYVFRRAFYPHARAVLCQHFHVAHRHRVCRVRAVLTRCLSLRVSLACMYL